MCADPSPSPACRSAPQASAPVVTWLGSQLPALLSGQEPSGPAGQGLLVAHTGLGLGEGGWAWGGRTSSLSGRAG